MTENKLYADYDNALEHLQLVIEAIDAVVYACNSDYRSHEQAQYRRLVDYLHSSRADVAACIMRVKECEQLSLASRAATYVDDLYACNSKAASTLSTVFDAMLALYNLLSDVSNDDRDSVLRTIDLQLDAVDAASVEVNDSLDPSYFEERAQELGTYEQ